MATKRSPSSGARKVREETEDLEGQAGTDTVQEEEPLSQEPSQVQEEAPLLRSFDIEAQDPGSGSAVMAEKFVPEQHLRQFTLDAETPVKEESDAGS